MCATSGDDTLGIRPDLVRAHLCTALRAACRRVFHDALHGRPQSIGMNNICQSELVQVGAISTYAGGLSDGRSCKRISRPAAARTAIMHFAICLAGSAACYTRKLQSRLLNSPDDGHPLFHSDLGLRWCARNRRCARRIATSCRQSAPAKSGNSSSTCVQRFGHGFEHDKLVVHGLASASCSLIGERVSRQAAEPLVAGGGILPVDRCSDPRQPNRL